MKEKYIQDIIDFDLSSVSKEQGKNMYKKLKRKNLLHRILLFVFNVLIWGIVLSLLGVGGSNKK